MAFYTKIDYSRQLKQNTDTSGNFLGSTIIAQDLYTGRNLLSYQPAYEDAEYNSSFWTDIGSCDCGECSTGYTFVVGTYSATSGSCNVTVTPFSGISGNSIVLAVGQKPMQPITGGTTNPGISASTVQIGREGLLDATGSYSDLSIDTSGNVVMGGSSSVRYKTNLNVVERGRYMELLKLNTYTFNYKSNGIKSFGLIAEEVDRLGLTELVMYDGDGKPDNIQYKLLSVSLLHLLQDLYGGDVNTYKPTTERDNITKVVHGGEYITNGEYIIVAKEHSVITLNSKTDTKIKIKSLAGVNIIPDKGLIDGRWENINLDGDSSVELVFVDELGYWVIVSSDGLKNS